MTQYPSACIEWLFKEEGDLADRVRAAKDAGFDAVEFHLWRDKPVDRLAAALDETGVRLTSFCVDPRRSMVDAAEHEEFFQAVADTIEAGRALGSPPLIVASGFTVDGRSDQWHFDNAVVALKRAAELAEAAGITLLLEPLNNRVELPLIHLHSTARALDLLEAVGSPNVKLLYDAYHSAVMEEDVPGVLDGRLHLVGHVQVAGAPGRHEPGSGDVDMGEVLRRLRAMGYEGGVGFEYLPTMPSGESVAMARTATGL